MTKFSLGDIVASEMNTILDSEEHTRLFSKTAKKKSKEEDKDDKKEDKEEKKSKKEDKKEDKKSKKDDKKDDKEDKKDKKDKEKDDKKSKKSKEKDEKDEKEMTSESFEKLVNTFTKISHILDECGLSKSSLITLSALDTVISELALAKFADKKCCDCEKCGKDCPCKGDCKNCECMDKEDTNDVKAIDVLQPEHMRSSRLPFDVETHVEEGETPSLYDSITELEADPHLMEVEELLSDPAAAKALDKSRQSEMLAQELSKPEYNVGGGFSSIENEPLDVETDIEDINDAKLLKDLGLSPLDEDPELSGVTSQRYGDAERKLLSEIGEEGLNDGDVPSGNTDIDELLQSQLGETEYPSYEDVKIPAPPKSFKLDPFSEETVGGLQDSTPEQIMETVRPGKLSSFEEEDVKRAFDKLDSWLSKHAQTMNEDDDSEADDMSSFDLSLADDSDEDEDFEDE